MGEDKPIQSSMSDAAQRKTTQLVGSELIAFTTADDKKKKKEKQIDEKTVDVLEILKQGYMECFKITSESDLPTFLQTHTQRAKIGFIPLWWKNVFTVLNDPDQDFNYSEDYKKLAENKWFYKYSESVLKNSHEFLTALKSDGFISSSDYSKVSLGARTLIIHVIKESILTFGIENKDIYDQIIIEKLGGLLRFISKIQTNPNLTIYFNQKPNNSDRTLKACVEYIKRQLSEFKDELFTKQKIRPILYKLEEINTTVTNIPKALLGIFPLLSGKSDIPSDYLIYIDQPDEERIPEKALEFLKSNIGQFILNIYKKGNKLKKNLEECNRLILLKSSGIDVSKQLLALMSDINQIINNKFLLGDSEFKDLPEWFFENPQAEIKKIKQEVQEVVTRICQAYMTIYISFPIYKSILTVGQGFGDLGLIERNENIVPYLESIQKKFLDLKNVLCALGSDTGMGTLSTLLSSFTLKIRDDDQNFSKREAWRRRVHHVEINLTNTLIPWLRETCLAQQNVIASLNDPNYYSDLRIETQKADVYLKSRVMEAVFRYSPDDFEKIVEEIQESEASCSLLHDLSIWAYDKRNVGKELILAGSTLPLTKKDLINYLVILNNYYKHVKEAVEKTKSWNLEDTELNDKIKEFDSLLKENDDWAQVLINKKTAIEIIKNNFSLEEDLIETELTREIFESYFKAKDDLKIYLKEFKEIKKHATDKDYERLRKICDARVVKSGTSLFQECQALSMENEQYKIHNQRLISQNQLLLAQKEKLDEKIKQLPDFTQILIQSLENAKNRYASSIRSLNAFQKLFHDEKGIERATKLINELRIFHQEGQYVNAVQRLIQFLNYYLEISKRGIFLEWLYGNEGKLREGSFRTHLLDYLSKITIEEDYQGAKNNRPLMMINNPNWNQSIHEREALLKTGVSTLTMELEALSKTHREERGIRKYSIIRRP